MLTVLTGCWGGAYPDHYIDKFVESVKRHMDEPCDIHICTEAVYPGWWGKIPLLGLQGPVLWIDIDCVIVGPLDDLLGTTGNIRTAKNWAQSGHGGCQSSVMYWDDASTIPALFDEKHVCWPPSNLNGRLWGDQEFITQLRDNNQIRVDYFDPAHVVSYKYHCRQGVPEDARVVCFHGRPNPDEVDDAWVSQHWA